MYLDKETFKNDYKRKLISLYRESVEDANDTLKYMALGSLIKDYMANDWHDTEVKYEREKTKQEILTALNSDGIKIEKNQNPLQFSKKCGIISPVAQGYSSAGRVPVSKTVGRGFESSCPCQKIRTRKCADFLLFHFSLFTFH